MDMIDNDFQISHLTALSALFAVKLFVTLGSVTHAGKCSVNYVSQIGPIKSLK